MGVTQAAGLSLKWFKAVSYTHLDVYKRQTTGSTGDGYRFAGAAGHTVTELSPALVPFVVKEPVVKELQGLSLKNIEATVMRGKKVIYREFGEMLFTHYGVSGPVLLSASSYAVKELKKGPLSLVIDLKPALSEEQLDARLLRCLLYTSRKRPGRSTRLWIRRRATAAPATVARRSVRR